MYIEIKTLIKNKYNCLIFSKLSLVSFFQVLHELLRQREDELAAVKEELQSIVLQSDKQEEQQSILQLDKPKIINEQIEQLQLMVLEKTAVLEEKEK